MMCRIWCELRGAHFDNKKKKKKKKRKTAKEKKNVAGPPDVGVE